ncbi:hypothetical protein [Variovorax sp. GT1P44]|uniref:hypothetical protein n=1 Tax=Variovorax sp. GT1P44 TaxID=3443742 RepID=UPI003F4860F5
MRAPRHRTRSPRHWAWMLWFALLLPMAQVASAAHALSHPVEPAGIHAGDKGLPHSFTCDLCLTAAALHGGALRSEPLHLPHSAAQDEAPRHAPTGTWQELLAPVYRSRAPPHATV